MSAVRRALGAALVVLLASAAPAAAKGDVVISQFRSQGPGGDFVEIANISGKTVHLGAGAWSLTAVDREAFNGCGITYGGPALTLAAGQHYLFADGSWTGTGSAARDAGFGSCGLYDAAGQLSLNMYSDAVTGQPLGGDSVTWGDIAPYGPSVNEPDKIDVAPSNGQVLQRKSAGTQDTNSNKNDFEVVDASPVNFPSTAPPPDATTTDATAITDSTATLHATANPHGKPV